MRYTRQTAEFHWPPVTPAVRWLLIVFGTVFAAETLFFMISPDAALSAYAFLSLSFGQYFHPVQILTHIFLSPSPGPGGVLNILIKGLILWQFGSDLERLWGTGSFLKFFATGLAGGALLSFGVSLIFLPDIRVAGFDAGLTAMLIAFAIIWPDRPVYFFGIFPITMKWLVLIFLAILFLSGSVNTMILHSGGALGGALSLLYYARSGRIYSGYLMKSSAPGQESGLVAWIRKKMKKRRLEKKQSVINERISMKEQVDALLEKISKEGMNSLTRKERQFLDKASKEWDTAGTISRFPEED